MRRLLCPAAAAVACERAFAPVAAGAIGALVACLAGPAAGESASGTYSADWLQVRGIEAADVHFPLPWLVLNENHSAFENRHVGAPVEDQLGARPTIRRTAAISSALENGLVR